MFKKISHWLQRRIIQQSSVSEEAWSNAFIRLPLLKRLTDEEKTRLREIAILLLHKKSFSGARGLDVTEEMKLIIALQACLPVLNLGIGWYRGWHSIIIYPAGFRPDHTFTDEAGVVHHEKRALSGEAWSRGPVILSWDEVKDAGIIDGENLVIHEFAHKLDMRNGIANGFPPLHKGMNKKQWAQVFTKAYENFHHRLRNDDASEIDRYAAHSPAEYFSVLSELFFERPDIINAEYPDVYKLMSQFYRQDTLKYFSASSKN